MQTLFQKPPRGLHFLGANQSHQPEAQAIGLPFPRSQAPAWERISEKLLLLWVVIAPDANRSFRCRCIAVKQELLGGAFPTRSSGTRNEKRADHDEEARSLALQTC